MQIKHHFGFHDENGLLEKLLIQRNIKFKKTMSIISADVCEESKNWKEIHKFLQNNNITSIIQTEFSEKEILEAQWSRLWSKWRWDYPKPEEDNLYRKYTYNDDNYCDKCGVGKIQKTFFNLSAEPNWGKKHFLQLNWIGDEIFVKAEIVEELQNAGIKGLHLLTPVHYKKLKELTTIKQIKVNDVLKNGLIVNENIIEQHCSKCNKVKYLHNGRGQIAFKREIFNTKQDIVKTNEYFGSGASADQFIIISRKFTKILIDQKYKDIAIEPLEII